MFSGSMVTNPVPPSTVASTFGPRSSKKAENNASSRFFEFAWRPRLTMSTARGHLKGTLDCTGLQPFCSPNSVSAWVGVLVSQINQVFVSSSYPILQQFVYSNVYPICENDANDRKFYRSKVSKSIREDTPRISTFDGHGADGSLCGSAEPGEEPH